MCEFTYDAHDAGGRSERSVAAVVCCCCCCCCLGAGRGPCKRRACPSGGEAAALSAVGAVVGL